MSSICASSSPNCSFSRNASAGTQDSGLTWCVLFSLEGFLILLFNALTLATFTVKARRRRSACFIMSLAAGDALVGGFAAPLQALTNYMIYSGHSGRYQVEDVWKTVDMFTGTYSMTAVTIISLERLYATLRPLRHRRTSNLMYYYGIAANVLMALTNTFLYSVFKNSKGRLHSMFLYMSINMVTKLVIIVVSYAVIFLNVRFGRLQRGTIKALARKRERDLAITLFIACAISILTWLPSSINLSLITLRGGELPGGVFQATSFLRYTSSLSNPIVYVFRIEEFRVALQSLCTKRFGK